MEYIANKPLYLTEADWSKPKNPKDFSFTPEMVKDKTPLELPDNSFIHGLANQGLIESAKVKAEPIRGKANHPAKPETTED